jgi:hypothetical protein
MPAVGASQLWKTGQVACVLQLLEAVLEMHLGDLLQVDAVSWCNPAPSASGSVYTGNWSALVAG